MKRGLTILAVATLAAAPAAMSATAETKKASPRAKVYRAAIGPVGADASYAGTAGKSQLVDTKRSDSIKIRMRGLQPGVTYPWHIHESAASNPCAEGARQGPIVSAFKYRALKANRRGRANSFGKARRGRFKVDPSKGYYVNVHNPANGSPIACGVLKKKPKKGKGATKPGKGKSPR